MTLQEIIEEMGYDTRSYSGRGMLGKSCLGVELAKDESPIIFAMDIGYAIAEYNEEVAHKDPLRLPKGIQQDQLGLGTILYFPREQFQGDKQ